MRGRSGHQSEQRLVMCLVAELQQQAGPAICWDSLACHCTMHVAGVTGVHAHSVQTQKCNTGGNWTTNAAHAGWVALSRRLPQLAVYTKSSVTTHTAAVEPHVWASLPALRASSSSTAAKASRRLDAMDGPSVGPAELMSEAVNRVSRCFAQYCDTYVPPWPSKTPKECTSGLIGAVACASSMYGRPPTWQKVACSGAAVGTRGRLVAVSRPVSPKTVSSE